MGQQASSHIQQATKVDVVCSADAGDMELWRNKVQSEVFFLRKDVSEWRRRLTKDEIVMLVLKESLLPRSILPISRLNGADRYLSDCTEIATDLSANSLQREVDRLNVEDCTMSESDITAIFGVLLFTAMAMEKNLDFHRSICMKNIFLVGNSVFLLNPYIKDSHLSRSIDTIVRPIIKIDDRWRPEYLTDIDLRSKASLYNDEIQSIIVKHRQVLGEMIISIGVVVLSVCDGKPDDYFIYQDGAIDKLRVDQSLMVNY
jgi:hypothetical protein